MPAPKRPPSTEGEPPVLVDPDVYELFDFEGLVPGDWRPLAVDDKIAEGRFFLDLMSKTTDWNQFRWLTSACLEAARAAMDWMAFRAHNVYYQDEDGNEILDEEYMKAIDDVLPQYFLTRVAKDGKVFVTPVHELLKYLSERRRRTAHYDSLWIKPEQVASPSGFYFKEGKTPVVQFCFEVLELLAGIAHEVHERSFEDAEQP